MEDTLRDLPSVDRVVRELGEVGLPRPLVLDVVRRELAEERRSRRDGAPPGDPLAAVRASLDRLAASRLRPVINGAGVIVHTNLGRAPLSSAAVDAIAATALGYTNLEYDLVAGERGRRGGYVEAALAVLCGAEAATVVNNCAAALVLILRHLARGERRQVIVSRGELVQIGGGFRVPEILEASGATLREVGTTNRTTLLDYERAIDERAAMILRVHRSNFYMGGFVASPAAGELAALARRAGLPFVEDLGSGAVFDTAALDGEREPTPRDAVDAGADLVCFSGDKLFGGAQAGIIVGRSERVAALKREPLFRALRCDKLATAALEATVDAHLSGDAGALPILSMMRTPCEALRERGGALLRRVSDLDADVALGVGESRVGGGSLPRTRIASVTIDVRPRRASPQQLAAALRRGRPPVVGYVAEGCFKLDLRTILPEQDAQVASALRAALTGA